MDNFEGTILPDGRTQYTVIANREAGVATLTPSLNPQTAGVAISVWLRRTRLVRRTLHGSTLGGERAKPGARFRAWI